MKKIILIIIIILEILLIKIPPYVELNNIAIIEEIKLIKKDNTYYLELKEIIPTKSDQSIKYKYKTYKSTGNTIKESLNNIKTKKKLYLNKVKSLNTNINKNIIKDELNIPIKRISIINNPS